MRSSPGRQPACHAAPTEGGGEEATDWGAHLQVALADVGEQVAEAVCQVALAFDEGVAQRHSPRGEEERPPNLLGRQCGGGAAAGPPSHWAVGQPLPVQHCSAQRARLQASGCASIAAGS